VIFPSTDPFARSHGEGHEGARNGREN